MKSLLHLLLVLMTSTLIANPSSKVDFIEGSLGLAIQKAGNEGKLLFVEFGAKWCMPCRFMEQNTFKDSDVATDTALSPYEIESQLHEAQKSRVNISPYEPTKIETSSNLDTQMSGVEREEKDQHPNTEPVVENRFDETPILEELIPEESAIHNSSIQTSDEELWADEEYEMADSEPEHKISLARRNEIKLETAEPEITFYTVIVGNFANNRSMKDYVKATSAIFIEDTHIFENNHEGYTTYEVCLGAFASETSANLFIEKLSLLNISGHIKSVKQ